MYRWDTIGFTIRAAKKVKKFVHNVLHQKEQVDDSIDRTESKARNIIIKAEDAAFNILEKAQKNADQIIYKGAARVIRSGLILTVTIFILMLIYHFITN